MEKIENAHMIPEDILFPAITLGEALLLNGAEVSRVEDTIGRICSAMGVERTDVFTITSSIVVTMCYHGTAYTQTRRIHNTEYNMRSLDRLNSLSREICARAQTKEAMGKQEILDRIDAIVREPGYGFGWMVLFYALSSSAFAVFFGGDLWDAAVSGLIGALLKPLQRRLSKQVLNPFLSAFLCSVFGGLLAVLSVRLGLGHSAEYISIGNIMLLIPGIAMTNGARDMFSGNTITGLLRFAEALLLAVVIALGFVWTSVRL